MSNSVQSMEGELACAFMNPYPVILFGLLKGFSGATVPDVLALRSMRGRSESRSAVEEPSVEQNHSEITTQRTERITSGSQLTVKQQLGSEQIYDWSLRTANVSLQNACMS